MSSIKFILIINYPATASLLSQHISWKFTPLLPKWESLGNNDSLTREKQVAGIVKYSQPLWDRGCEISESGCLSGVKNNTESSSSHSISIINVQPTYNQISYFCGKPHIFLYCRTLERSQSSWADSGWVTTQFHLDCLQLRISHLHQRTRVNFLLTTWISGNSRQCWAFIQFRVFITDHLCIDSLPQVDMLVLNLAFLLL